MYTVAQFKIDEQAARPYLKAIEVLYNSIDFKSINAKDNLILDCYASATIEGANTTVNTVKKAISQKANYDKGTVMATNCFSCIEKYKDCMLDEETLLGMWSTIVDGVCENEDVRGIKYRSGAVCVGDYNPPSWDKVQFYMDDFFKLCKADIPCLLKACIAHFYLVWIHPFGDGNGRLARFIFSKVLYDGGMHDVFKVLISNTIMNYQNAYYKNIKLSENTENDITPFVIYSLQILVQSLRAFLVQTPTDLENAIYNLISKHAGAEITAERCSKILSVDLQTVKQALDDMVARGTLMTLSYNSHQYYTINHLKELNVI